MAGMDALIGARVLVDGKMSGTVVGLTATVAWKERGPYVLALVGLDVGLWANERQTYISVLTAHPDNLTLINSPPGESEMR